MRHKCRLIECKPVAIIATQVENNLVTINPRLLANPRYKTAIYIEIIEETYKPWDTGIIRLLLIFNGVKYELIEFSDPDKRQNQTFTFALLEEVNPQVESIIERAIPDAL